MEGTPFFYMAFTQHQQYKQSVLAKRSNNPDSGRHHSSTTINDKEPSTNHDKFFQRPHISSSIILKLRKLRSQLVHLRPLKMPSGLVVLHVPSDPDEAPQFVRLARKGIGMKVVFLHPNGSFYKLPYYKDLKGQKRDCGPQTSPVFGSAKRTCDGGCCAWFTVDVEFQDRLQRQHFQEFKDRPKHDVFLVRHGSKDDTKANVFMEEGLDHVRASGSGWFGRAKLYK